MNLFREARLSGADEGMDYKTGDQGRGSGWGQSVSAARGGGTLKVRARCVCVLGNLWFRLYQESVHMFWKNKESPAFNSEETQKSTGLYAGL